VAWSVLQLAAAGIS